MDGRGQVFGRFASRAEEEAVLEVLRSGMLAMGKRTAAFEEAWAAYCGVRHAILMSNGTVALEAILQALGIGPGDEVITVSFSFNATVSAILRVGATPVFVDVREDDFCIDPAAVEAAVTPYTKAILPVHLYGLMADMDPLLEIAERHGLQIVEDAAQAHGATYRGVALGGGRPVVDVDDGLWALAIASGLLRAAAEAQPVDLAAFGATIPSR